MPSRPFLVAAAAVGALAALAGLVDAVRGGQADLAVLFGLALASLIVLAVGSCGPRRAVGLRADLARWLEQRSATTGEPVRQMVDRAVADHRARVAGTPVSDPIDEHRRTS